MQTPYVWVQFRSKTRSSVFGGPCYTYIADTPLEVGDIVKAPTKYGDQEAFVCRVDVPEAVAARFHGELRHITEPVTVSPGLFDEFFD